MTREALKTLFYPFEADALALPATGARMLFLGAEPGFSLPDGFDADLTVVQGFRPYFRALTAAGYSTVPAPEGEGYDGALVLCGRHRGQNEAWLADAIERVRTGGLILVAGSNDDGVASLRKRVEKIVQFDGNLPKYHGLAFWFTRSADASAAISALGDQKSDGLADGRFIAAPGMFSHDRVDAGSKLLAECLPDTCRGTAADFCAGWGYLSVALLERTSGLKSMDLYEADHASLEAARQNLQAVAPKIPLGFFWQDLAAEKVTKKYDLIVMNPPFHQGRAAEPEIGQAMIKAASGALKSGGRLFMVANRGLPYDETVRAGFSRAQELRREAAFRVVVAYK